MARTEIERTVLPSVLDRLTDHDPRLPDDPPVTRAESVRRFRDAVMRDVEWLLNTRAPHAPIPAGLVGVRRSAYAYGLPDTTGLVGGAQEARAELFGWVRATIAAFEPRLADVQIELVGGGDATTPEVRFTLSALLCMDPSPEQVVFDTVLDPVNGSHTVRPAEVARPAAGPGGGARA
ncbi:type VI secretion system baseplate subunit TssE [Roseisolibacter sp. H3M3-2]|uniref:type VI secretion system baseplate subunit TssE n=1 Tax=Roseisolibacter sp. H3M3-2 TaxID=3031323 RepID=UPI0023DAAB63|nr:type VI secretion system baseplate subunit TssE [Roseisolibacter sp. H3M3-2]MDF1505655.1 type VI secretion system baseplate subunit TssE [Roseisolibacter sp. H3M3-2]